MGYRLGIDLGGTKIELIALDEHGDVLHRRRVPTPAGDYDQTIRTLVELVSSAEADLDLSGSAARPSVGVGIPGMVSPATGLVKNANSTCLIGHPLDRDLEDALKRPIRIANDADCFTLSEASDGSGTDAHIVFGVILGTGVGGGLAINKSIIRGPNAITGEWGHNPLPWPDDIERPGPPCYCGKSGCIETFLSGAGLSNDMGTNGGKWNGAQDIAEAAADGNSSAKSALSRYTKRLAKALASIINVIDPDVIVLGGGLSNIEVLYTDVPSIWGGFVFSDEVVTRLAPPRHGDSSGVRGAAWLWPAVS